MTVWRFIKELGWFRLRKLYCAMARDMSFPWSLKILPSHVPGWFILSTDPKGCIAVKITSDKGFVVACRDSKVDRPQLDLYRRKPFFQHELVAVDIAHQTEDVFLKHLVEQGAEARKRFFTGDTVERRELLGEDVSDFEQERLLKDYDPDVEASFGEIERMLDNRP